MVNKRLCKKKASKKAPRFSQKGAMGNALFRMLAQRERERVGLNVALSLAPKEPTAPKAPSARRRVLPTERHAIALVFEHRCASCRVLLPIGWHLDHVVPLSDGGADEDSNMQPLCTPCHTLKTALENAARLPRQARQAPQALPALPAVTRERPSLEGQTRAKRRKLAHANGANGAIGAVDMRRAIVLTGKCAAHFHPWRAKGESFRVDRYVRILGKSMTMLLSEKAMVQKTRNAAAHAPYRVGDLRHDLKCGFVELGVEI